MQYSQLHAPAVLTPEKQTALPTEQTIERVSRSALCEDGTNQTPILRSFGLVTTHIKLLK
jgi:hypothetical protein